jgi:hypothetical protein
MTYDQCHTMNMHEDNEPERCDSGLNGHVSHDVWCLLTREWKEKPPLLGVTWYCGLTNHPSSLQYKAHTCPPTQQHVELIQHSTINTLDGPVIEWHANRALTRTNPQLHLDKGDPPRTQNNTLSPVTCSLLPCHIGANMDQ